ncbi:MAG: zinc-ribbon domain-containing protein [Chloroflexota bacterium]|nr:zinc-ribbon domain-containing protein [Chloroflexota bacterium]
MAQNPARSCPNCHAVMPPNQRFCSNCGAVVEGSAYRPTELTPNSAGSLPNMETRRDATPPPPPQGFGQAPFPGQQMPPQQGFGQAPFPGQQMPPPNYQGYQAPVYTKPQKDSSKGVLGQIGCGVLAVILVVLALCGGAGFFAYHYITTAAHSGIATVTTGNTSSSVNDVTPTVAPPVTSPVNAALIYADVNITVVDAKQGGGFADDPGTSTPSVVRIDLKEENKTTHSSGYYYGDMARLLLPDGTSVKPDNTQILTGPDATISRTNWVDFSVSSKIDVAKSTLVLGKVDEEQINVPLISNPDMSKYQPKMVTPGKTTTYSGMTWTLVSASKQLSGDNQQAPQGQVYVVMTLKIDNNSANGFSNSPGDYMRLQTGSTKATPNSDNTLPLGVSAGQTNQTGTCAFLVPQGSTDFTLLLLADSTGSVQQASIPFQIQ